MEQAERTKARSLLESLYRDDLEFEEIGHLYKIGDRFIPSATQILTFSGLSSFEVWGNEKCIERGNAIDKCIKLYLMFKDVSDSDVSFIEYSKGVAGENSESRCFEAFQKFVDSENVELIGSDIKVVGNVSGDTDSQFFEYAGEIDLLVLLDGSIFIIEVKSSRKTSTYPKHLSALQTILYLLAVVPKARSSGIETIGRACLYLSEEGKYRLKRYTDRENVFHASVAIGLVRLMGMLRGRNYYKEITTKMAARNAVKRLPYASVEEIVDFIFESASLCSDEKFIDLCSEIKTRSKEVGIEI